MNKSKLIKIIVVSILCILLIVEIVIKVTDKPKKEEKVFENGEEVLNKNDYAYLLDDLFSFNCAVDSLDTYMNIDQLSNEIKLEVAIGSMNAEDIKIGDKDEIDYFNDQIDIKTLQQYSSYGYKSSNVDKQAKKIFGKNTNLEHKSTDDVIYDKTTKSYVLIPHSCGEFGKEGFQSILKITKKDNELYIYTIAGSYTNYETIDKAKICYDYNVGDESTCTLVKDLDQKYMNNNVFAYDDYALDNKEKFAHYKYTYELEDGNYIIKKLEKING